MGGQRERKKTNTREKILAAAQKIFTAKGFSAATTAELAREANIAEGTIYNYFSSKGHILVTLVQRAFFDGTYNFERVPVTVPEAVEEILKFLDHYLHTVRTISKSLLREVYAVAFKPTDEGTFVLTQLVRFDAGLLDQMRGFLALLVDNGLIKLPEKPEVFLDMVYGIVMYQFGKFILVKEMTYDTFLEEMGDKLRLLMTGSVNG